MENTVSNEEDKAKTIPNDVPIGVTKGRLRTIAHIRRFLLAPVGRGAATFTLKNTARDTRLTFRVRRAPGDDTGRPWFVAVRTGPDSFDYLGCIWPRPAGESPRFARTRASKIGASAPSQRTMRWLLDRLAADSWPAVVEFWHEGRCGRCGRSLTVPESIQSGIGPVCAERL